MNWKDCNVLVLDGNSRQILPILQGLHEVGCVISTVNHSKFDNGWTSRYPDKRLLLPKGNEAIFYKELLGLIESRNYDVLLPLSDEYMDLVTRHYTELSSYLRLPIPSREVFMKAYDKQNTMCICMANQIPCPITKYDNETLESFLEKVKFPLVAKPRNGFGSIGLKIIQNYEQLNALLQNKIIKLEKYVLQEFIPQSGQQLNIHLFMDDNQKVCSGLVTEKTRWFPIDGGASCLCRTITNKKVLDDCISLLKAISWRSYCEIEMIVDPRDGIAKVMEINGRASASIKIMSLAGINIAEQMLQLAYNKEVDVHTGTKDDVRLRRLITDILWFIQSPYRFRTKPSWFSFARTHETTFSFADPLPFFVSLFSLFCNCFSYKNEMKKRMRT